MDFGDVIHTMQMYSPFPEDPQPRFRRECWRKGIFVFFDAINKAIRYRADGFESDYFPDTEDMMAAEWEEIEYDREENA